MEELISTITSLTACLAALVGTAIGFLFFWTIFCLKKWTDESEARKKKLQKSQEDDIAFIARNEAFKACFDYMKGKKNVDSEK